MCNSENLKTWICVDTIQTRERYDICNCFGTFGRFKQLHELGEKVADSSSNVGALDVGEYIDRIAQGRNELDELWKERQKKLQENIALHKFIKEVDSILAAISSHEAFFQTDNLGVNTNDFISNLD